MLSSLWEVGVDIMEAALKGTEVDSIAGVSSNSIRGGWRYPHSWGWLTRESLMKMDDDLGVLPCMETPRYRTFPGNGECRTILTF